MGFLCITGRIRDLVELTAGTKICIELFLAKESSNIAIKLKYMYDIFVHLYDQFTQ